MNTQMKWKSHLNPGQIVMGIAFVCSKKLKSEKTMQSKDAKNFPPINM